MGSFKHLLVGGQRQPFFKQALGVRLVLTKASQQGLNVACLEVVGGLFHLVLMIDIAIEHTMGLRGIVLPLTPGKVEDVFNTLQVHGKPLKAVGNFAGNGLAVDATHLLKIGELGNLHAV